VRGRLVIVIPLLLFLWLLLLLLCVRHRETPVNWALDLPPSHTPPRLPRSHTLVASCNTHMYGMVSSCTALVFTGASQDLGALLLVVSFQH
jgi:hypothetical protein